MPRMLGRMQRLSGIPLPLEGKASFPIVSPDLSRRNKGIDSITGGLDDGVVVSNQALRWRAAWGRKQCFTQAHGILARREDRQVYGEIVGCHRGGTLSASVRVADPPPKKTSTAGRMAESQCLPQAHDFFRNAKVRRWQRSCIGCTARAAHSCCCSNWSGCFWNGRGHTLFCTHRQFRCLEGEGSSFGTVCRFKEIRCLSRHWLQRWEFQHQEPGGVETSGEPRAKSSSSCGATCFICSPRPAVGLLLSRFAARISTSTSCLLRPLADCGCG